MQPSQAVFWTVFLKFFDKMSDIESAHEDEDIVHDTSEESVAESDSEDEYEGKDGFICVCNWTRGGSSRQWPFLAWHVSSECHWLHEFGLFSFFGGAIVGVFLLLFRAYATSIAFW